MSQHVQFRIIVRAWWLIVFVVAVGGASADSAKAERPQDRTISSLRDLNNALTEIAESVTPAVVTISTARILRVRQDWTPFSPFGNDPFFGFFGGHRPRRSEPQEFRQQGLGSGVIVSPDGVIITNNHVIAEADSIVVQLADGRRFAAMVVGTDPRTDVAVLRVEARALPYLPTGNSDDLKVGEIVLAVGSPLSAQLAHTVTQGIVSAKGRSNIGLADYEDFIQTDAAINRGNSGGALVNLDGELVGINTAIASQSGGNQGIGFAVPVNMVTRVRDAILADGKVTRGWLGVWSQDLTDQLRRSMDLPNVEGALIGDVASGSPAEQAGLQAGDIITRLNGRTINNSTQLRTEIAAIAPDSDALLTVLRDGKEQRITARLGELPEDRRRQRSTPAARELLGFVVKNLTPDVATQRGYEMKFGGVVVSQIDESSMAYDAGLREGDLIRAINRARVSSAEVFYKIADSLKEGDEVLLQVVRAESGSFFIAFRA